jgi:2-oxoglutarate ferredoxin oxidoreductase subunit alpha
MIDFSLIVGGEAGFGIMTTGALFSRIVTRLGYHIFDYVEYPSLIRGGHNAYIVHVTDTETRCLKSTVDFLVCLNKDTFTIHKDKLTSSSYVVYDSEEFGIDGDNKKVSVPFKKILEELKGQAVMKNTIALGAILALLGSDLTILNALLEKQFGKKGQEVISFNKQFAEKGFNHVKSQYTSLITALLPKKESEEKLVLSGNEAFSLGAVIADCRLYCAYPMTPSSSVLTTLAAWQEKTGMIVRHAEDEISVINTAIGSSFAGVRSAVGTSGGGFALMVESVSLAGVTETPLVIFIAQRPGPATGMPTWTEQGDLLFAVHAGHGEFQKIVLSAGDVGEMLEVTLKAFDLADIYQLPVIVLSEMLLSESHASLTKSFVDSVIKQYALRRGKTITESSEKPYLRYKITDDGISPRLIPGAKGVFYQANSYEHIEDGHTTEEVIPRIQQVEKRGRKWQTYLKNDFEGPKVFGDIEKADTVLISWGGNKGAILKALEVLKERSKEVAYLHFTHLYPLNSEKLKPLFTNNKRYMLVENNFDGQFGRLLRLETGIDIKDRLLRYDGRQITPEQVVEKIL